MIKNYFNSFLAIFCVLAISTKGHAQGISIDSSYFASGTGFSFTPTNMSHSVDKVLRIDDDRTLALQYNGGFGFDPYQSSLSIHTSNNEFSDILLSGVDSGAQQSQFLDVIIDSDDKLLVLEKIVGNGSQVTLFVKRYTISSNNSVSVDNSFTPYEVPISAYSANMNKIVQRSNGKYQLLSVFSESIAIAPPPNPQFETVFKMAIEQLNSDGTPDNNFSATQNFTSIDLPDFSYAVLATKVVGTRLYVAYSNNNAGDILMAVNENGTKDTGFNDDVVIFTSLAAFNFIRGIELTNDGKLLISGYATNAPSSYAGLAILNTDGSVASSSAAMNAIAQSTGSVFNHAIQLQTGEIIAGSFEHTYIYDEDLAPITAYNANGYLLTETDNLTSFMYFVEGNDGKITYLLYLGGPRVYELKRLKNTEATSVGIKNEIISEAVSLFPNPVNELLFIHTEADLVNYKIVNLLGQTVDLGMLRAKQINTSALEKGSYYLLLENQAKQNVVLPFVK